MSKQMLEVKTLTRYSKRLNIGYMLHVQMCTCTNLSSGLINMHFTYGSLFVEMNERLQNINPFPWRPDPIFYDNRISLKFAVVV